MTENLLFFSIKRLILSFINVLIFVVPLEYIGVMFGVFESFNGRVVFMTAGALALIQLSIILYSIDVEVDEE